MTAAVVEAGPPDASAVTALVHALLAEIMAASGGAAFQPDPVRDAATCLDLLRGGRLIALLAHRDDGPQGVLCLSPAQALYTGGSFGIITEFYVRPDCRGQGLGRHLLGAALKVARRHGWRRLEVTTPPLPAFAATLRFYERAGFSVTGGRKLQRTIAD